MQTCVCGSMVVNAIAHLLGVKEGASLWEYGSCSSHSVQNQVTPSSWKWSWLCFGRVHVLREDRSPSPHPGCIAHCSRDLPWHVFVSLQTLPQLLCPLCEKAALIGTDHQGGSERFP